MALRERSQICMRGFKFKTHILCVIEFKPLSLFCDLNQ